jgi:hypothetical protein
MSTPPGPRRPRRQAKPPKETTPREVAETLERLENYYAEHRGQMTHGESPAGDRTVLYRKMSKREWNEATNNGKRGFNFTTAFKNYQTGDYARVWTSTDLAKVRGFNNEDSGETDYVIVEFVLDQDVTKIFSDILPQKMTGAQHNIYAVLMHREGYKPFLHGSKLIKMFKTQEEVAVTIMRGMAFDLGFSAVHAPMFNKHLKSANQVGFPSVLNKGKEKEEEEEEERVKRKSKGKEKE